MGVVVVTGASWLCPFGASGTFVATSNPPIMMGGMACGVITESSTSNVVVNPGCMCTSPANPLVQAAQGAPVPCVILPAGIWQGGNSKVSTNGAVLTTDCCLTCTNGGTLKFTNPGQNKVII